VKRTVADSYRLTVRLLAAALCFVIASPSATLAVPDTKTIDKDTYESLFKLGVSNASFFYEQFHPTTDETITDNEVRRSLIDVSNAYRKSVNNGRGATGLLSSTLDVALAFTDYGSGGTAFVATVPIRWVKNKGIDYLNAEIEKEAAGFFAKNLNQIQTQTGLTYEKLREQARQSPKQAIETINGITQFQEVKNGLKGEPLAQGALENAIVDMLVSTERVTLEKTLENTQDISSLGKRLDKVTLGLTKYVSENNARVSDLNIRLGEAEKAISKANRDIESLREATSNNTQQLQAVSAVLFSRSSPQDQLVLLNGGYLKGVLADPERNKLVSAVEAQAKKQELLGKMNAVVADFNKIGQVAQNLNIDAPELFEAINVANQVSGIISDVAGGDYLGAVVGLTGIFGKRVDPAAERHKQLMEYLGKQFEEVNEKLKQILESQQKIMEGIFQLSKQMAEYDKALHQRLDRIEDKIDTNHDLAFTLLYLPMGDCQATVNDIRDNLGINDTTRVGDLRKIDPLTASRVRICGEYMRTLFNSAFNPAIPGLESMALRYSAAPESLPRFKVPDSEKEKYYQQTELRTFLDSYYKPANVFITERAKTKGWKFPNLLTALAIPSKNIPGLTKKLDYLSQVTPSCDSKTVISDPLIAAICPRPDRFKLPEHSSIGDENTAIAKAEKLLGNPLLYDATDKLAEWALFYAPIYDVMDFERTIIEPDYDVMLKKANYRPQGKALLVGAQQVNAISLAQMNLLYGDIMAKWVFDLIWDSGSKRFLADSELTSDPQKKAKALFKLENPFLLRNVLMLALNDSSKVTESGQKLAYAFALQWSITSKVTPYDGLKSVFGENLQFKNNWIPAAMPADEAQRAACQTATEVDGQGKGCVPIPSVMIYDIPISLPSPDEFAGREFYYPNALRRMIATRDQLATRLADYNFIEAAVSNSANKAADRKRIITALISATK